jgi:hypothetical protein
MYPWESKELIELKELRQSVSKMWNHTELDLDGVSKEFLVEEMKLLSDLINQSVLNIDTEMNRLVKRDIESSKSYTCSHCEGEKIYICDPCSDKMYKTLGRPKN